MYIDESGCTGTLPSRTSKVQPVLVIAGIIIPAERIKQLTFEFLQLKRSRFPKLMVHSDLFLDCVLSEIKGSDLRKNAISSQRRIRRQSIGFLDEVMRLCSRHHASILARVWIKNPGKSIDGYAIYTASVQRMCASFNHYLASTDSFGLCIADARSQTLNKSVAHSIFTQKHQMKGDEYPRIIEMPSFAHSDNMVGLQIADVIASGLIHPIAVNTYCEGQLDSIHVKPEYSKLRERYAPQLKAMQYRYRYPLYHKRCRGGIVVSDRLTKRSGSEMFR